MRAFIVVLAIIVLAASQSCEVSESLRTDCGYFGINQQQCEAKGCCWKPTALSTDDTQ